MRVLILHGPSLNLLGRREQAVYGSQTLADIDEALEAEARALDIDIKIEQTAREGRIVEALIEGLGEYDAAIVNPAAYSHTSRAIADAVRSVSFPVIEVHLSNIHAREEWRRISVTAEACAGVIAGFGATSYLLALRAAKEMVS